MCSRRYYPSLIRLVGLFLLLLGYSVTGLPSTVPGAVSQGLTGSEISAEQNLKSQSSQIPDGHISIIIQFERPAVSNQLDSFSGDHDQLSPLEKDRIRAYKKQLQMAHKQFLTAAERAGVQLRVQHAYTFLINGLAVSTASENLGRLQAMPGVKAVYPDVDVSLSPQEVKQTAPISLAGVSTTGASSFSLNKAPRVAILDTGIDYTHPDLGGCFGPGCKVVAGYDLYNHDADPRDDNGHGTHCAGIVAADGTIKGLAPHALLYAYKVLDAVGAGSMSTVVAGIERAVDPDQDPATPDGVDIINLSIGVPGSPDDLWSLAVDKAVQAGVLVVTSAGNYGPEYGILGSPGVAREALAVGAIDAHDQLASFSSRGPVAGFDHLLKPQILAPGVEIPSTWLEGGYQTLSGTSMAAPHITGAAALLKQENPTWSPDRVRAALLNQAQDLSLDIYSQGAGKLDLSTFQNIGLVVKPDLIGLGMADLNQPFWSAAESLQVYNVSSDTRQFVLTPHGGSPGMTVTLDPETLLIEPGKVGSSTLTIIVETAQVRPDLTLNQGRVFVESGEYRAEVPFAFRVPDLFSSSLTLPYVTQSTYGVALGDLDGDGDSDAFLANADYYEAAGNTVWLNNGEGLFSDSGQKLGDAFARSVDLGDLDGDGDLDAFVANSGVDEPLPDSIWFNDGAGIFTRSGQSLGNSFSQDVRLGDLDADGDLDAFVANSRFSHGSGEANQVWLNTGQGTFMEGQRLGKSLSQAVALGDLDGDGDLDAFIANGVAEREFGRPNKIWLNNGAGWFTDSGQELGDSISQDVDLGDLDGDGDLDAFVANGAWDGGQGQPDRIWLNNGAAFFSDSGQDLGMTPSYGVALADLHGDGVLDAFVARYRGGNMVWLNNGLGIMHPSSPGFGSESSVDVVAGDIDNDGDVDALLANVLGKPNRAWFNRGSGSPASGVIHVQSRRGDAAWHIQGPVRLVGQGTSTRAGVPPGTYQIVWNSVSGCATPPPQTKTLSGGGNLVFAGEFSACPPSPPGLFSPVYGVLTDATPDLTWLAVAAVDGYRLQLDDNLNFGSPVIDQIVTSSTYSVQVALAEGAYYWRVRSLSASGDSAWGDVGIFTVIKSESLPFFEGFESGTLPMPWSVFTTATGRVKISPEAAYQGSSGLLLDDEKANGAYSTAAADLMIDLEDQASSILSFVWRNWREGQPHGQSGVYISDDYGRSWHRVLTFEGQRTAFQFEAIDMKTKAAEHGLTTNDHMVIRVQSLEDDPLLAGGGIALDNLAVAAGPLGPTNLTLTGISPAGVELRWQDNADDESAYYVERRSGGDSFALLGAVPANSTSFVDDDLLCGTPYTYRVRAYRAADGAYSPYSDPASHTTAVCNQVRYWLPVVANAFTGS